MVADSDYIIPFVTEILIDPVRSMVTDVDTSLQHDLHSFRIYLSSRFSTG